MEQPPAYDEIVSYPTMPAVPNTGSSMAQHYAMRQQQVQQQQAHLQQQQQRQYMPPSQHSHIPQQHQPQQHQPQQHLSQQQHHIRRPKLGTVSLYDDNTERRRMTELADLFAIIKVTEFLETAYSRDAISSQSYDDGCKRLITQFRSTESALIGAGIISGTDVFIREFNIDCPRARDRLLKQGATALDMFGRENRVVDDSRVPDSVVVAETVQAFITAIDALALLNYAIDTVQPLLVDLMGALTRVSSLPPDFEALVKMRLWLQKLNEMRAFEELNEEEARQLKFDLESSYQAFMKHLSS